MQVYYNPSYRSNLKIQFPGLENIQENYSNLCQDLFVLSILNGKTNGTYLEIGGHLPIIGNNTYMLEKLYGWKGVSVEFESKYRFMWEKERTNPIYIQDALTTDYTDLLNNNNIDSVIDYLSCDIEPQDATFSALKKIDHNLYKFRVITFEHDYYNGGTGPEVREKSRQFLSSLGYKMLVGDVSHQGHKIEDWWVYPDLVDSNICKILEMHEAWNADEAIYINPISAKLKQKNNVISNLDQGYMSFV